MSETILTNAVLVLEKETIRGSIVFGADGIRAVSAGASTAAGAIDCGGDYVIPGLVEMHTDNAEKHFVPRPGVYWPDGLGAILAHDAQMAAAGVTTVYDSICAGSVTGRNDHRRFIFGRTVEAVSDGVARGVFRIDHMVHIRCELTAPEVVSDVEPYADNPLVKLISLMDHTPGQRQYRNIEFLKRYNLGSGEKTLEEHERDVAQRMEEGPANKRKSWPVIVDMFGRRGIPIATHDDTTVSDVDEAVAAGAVISEFPTTVEAAAAAKQHRLTTIAGAPNVVRGGSHSGNVSAIELAEKGLLDGLSSDYVPSSLLQAVLRLHGQHGVALPDAIGMVTWRIADVVGLSDRGHLRPGLRADIVRFSDVGGTPVVREVYAMGRRVC
ncbi:MAG: alpha-D-ribose 1-methylphosphonate 5-triphosphate diphosphatase [Hyphomicrobiaceae bacterium]